MRIKSLLYLCLVMSMVGCGPIVMLPGGELSGDVQPTPSSWAFTDEIETVQLETRPSDPYSVNIWAVAAGDSLYIAAGGGAETTWARHIDADPQVRLRVGNSLFELNAVQANDEATRNVFLIAAKKKYDFEPDEEDASNAVLYRLDPR